MKRAVAPVSTVVANMRVVANKADDKAVCLDKLAAGVISRRFILRWTGTRALLAQFLLLSLDG
jgi:hypothetical protein